MLPERRFTFLLFWDIVLFGCFSLRNNFILFLALAVSVADVMTQSRQEDSDLYFLLYFFFFSLSDLPPGIFWQGGNNFKLNVNVEAFQSPKLQRFLSMAQGEIKLSNADVLLWWEGAALVPKSNLDTREALSITELLSLHSFNNSWKPQSSAGFSLLHFPSLSRWWLLV